MPRQRDLSIRCLYLIKLAIELSMYESSRKNSKLSRLLVNMKKSSAKFTSFLVYSAPSSAVDK